MTWADQTEQRLVDIESALGADRELRRGVARLRRVMALREFAGGRVGRFLPRLVAVTVTALITLLGLLLGASGPAVLAALITGAVLAGAVAFALGWAVLDHRAGPLSDESR